MLSINTILMGPCLKGVLLFAFLCKNAVLFAQMGPQRILATFEYKGKAYNYEFLVLEKDPRYSFKVSTLNYQESGTDSTSIGNAPVSRENSDGGAYLFSSLDQKSFVVTFMDQMEKKFSIDSSKELENKGLEIFFTVKARLDFIDDEPVTAYLILRKDVMRSFLQSNFSQYYTGGLSNLITSHAVEEVNVETKDGAIKNITVKMIDTALARQVRESPRQYLEFKNPYPIGISGKFDPEKFSNIKLYCFNCNGIIGLSRYIHLSDLLSLDIVLENDKDDYSPSDRTVKLTRTNPIQELRKEKRSRILEIAAFSDFVGLDQEQPNGLIQIEARRKININSKSRLLHRIDQGDEIADKYNLSRVYAVPADSSYDNGSKKGHTWYNLFKINYVSPAEVDSITRGRPGKQILRDTAKVPFDRIPILQKKFRSPYYTFFPYIEPVLLFSKLEQSNRLIDSGKAVNNRIDPVQLHQYQLASLGVNLEVLKVNFPQLKFSWNLLHGGFYWFRTRVAVSSDTNGKSVALNSNFWQIGTSASFNPEPRWGVSFGIKYIHPQLFNKEYSLTSKDGLWQPFFDAYFKKNKSDDSKLFFRFRWTSAVNDHSNNFTQIQLGYSTNLFVGTDEPAAH